MIFTEAVITKKNVVPRRRIITLFVFSEPKKNLKTLKILETSSYLENAMACKLFTPSQALMLSLP